MSLSALGTEAAEQQEDDHEKPAGDGQEDGDGTFLVFDHSDQPHDRRGDESSDGGDNTQDQDGRLVLQETQHFSQQEEQQYGEQRAQAEPCRPFTGTGGGENFHGAPRFSMI